MNGQIGSDGRTNINASLKNRSSNDIELHRLIVSKKEDLALACIDRMLSPTRCSSGSVIVCYVSSGKKTLADDVQKITANDILNQIKIDLLPHPFEINAGKLQDSLQLAAAYGLEKVVEKLLGLGAAPNYRCGNYRTALHYAAASRNNSIIKLLVLRGADINLRDQTLSFPINIYLHTSEQPEAFSEDILALLRIDHLRNYRNPDGTFISSKLNKSSLSYLVKKFYEDIARIQMDMDKVSESFAQKFFHARREKIEVNKSAELNFSLKNLILMVKLLNVIGRFPTEYIETIIEDQSLFWSLQLFSSLVENLAKETKCPYQTRVPWNSLTFIGCLLNLDNIRYRSWFITEMKGLVNGLSVIKTELIDIINEYHLWLDKNSKLTYIPPYQHNFLTNFYNLTDYFHDLETMSKVLVHLGSVNRINLSSYEGRVSIIQIIKVVADLCKYQHAGRNLTRTIKEKIPNFPWHDFGELRDKLAKISLSQSNVETIQKLIEDKEGLFFSELRQELLNLYKYLDEVRVEHENLNNEQFNTYYIKEPTDAYLARDDMTLFAPIIEKSIEDLRIVIERIKSQKCESIQANKSSLKEQLVKIKKNQRLPADKKAELIIQKIAKIEDLQKEIDKVNQPFDDILLRVFEEKRLLLKDQRFLLERCNKDTQTVIKKIISQSSPFKRILELEQKFSMNVDKAFLELDIGQQCVVVNRTKDYFNKLAEIVIPDKDKRQNIICNNKIFDPGYDEFSFYLLQQYVRIKDDKSLFYAVHYFAVECNQSLRFIEIGTRQEFQGGNQDFRVHIEHDNRMFDMIAPDRLIEELNEILKNITKDLLLLDCFARKYHNTEPFPPLSGDTVQSVYILPMSTRSNDTPIRQEDNEYSSAAFRVQLSAAFRGARYTI